MKNLLSVIFIITIGTLSCFSQTNSGTKQENKGKTIELTKADFLKKVVDYETNPNEWKYLGDKQIGRAHV